MNAAHEQCNQRLINPDRALDIDSSPRFPQVYAASEVGHILQSSDLSALELALSSCMQIFKLVLSCEKQQTTAYKILEV